MNLYGYAGADPVNNVDPFGLCLTPLLVAAAADGPAPVGEIVGGLYCAYRGAVALKRIFGAASKLGSAALETRSHTTGRTRSGPEIEVHWEEPTSSGDPGNVHYQGVGGDKNNIPKTKVTDPNDPSQLPKALRSNVELRRLLRRAHEQLQKFREQNPPPDPS